MQRRQPHIGGDKMRSMFDKHRKWLDSAERMLESHFHRTAKNSLHKRTLIMDATTKRGRKMRHGIPHITAVNYVLEWDDRFVYKGKDTWGLRKYD